jgi:hypothetical protein
MGVEAVDEPKPDSAAARLVPADAQLGRADSEVADHLIAVIRVRPQKPAAHPERFGR